MRHDMLATKANLEVQHVQHKEAVKTFKAIKEDVQVSTTCIYTCTYIVYTVHVPYMLEVLVQLLYVTI